MIKSAAIIKEKPQKQAVAMALGMASKSAKAAGKPGKAPMKK
jgi:hypothetical protein